MVQSFRKLPIFLTASWEHLIMASYEVSPAILMPYLPAGAQLDYFQEKTFVSIVAFRFCHTRVMKSAIPFHRHFTEVNLRFYVRYQYQGEWRRGTVFISELVPKPMVVIIANWLFKEHYGYAPMRHSIRAQADDSLEVAYQWKKRGEWHRIMAVTAPTAQAIGEDSPEAFIAEHYWGYTPFGTSQTLEYGVEHPRWEIFPIRHFEVSSNAVNLYGSAFEPYLSQPPASVLLAKGSDVLIRQGTIYRF